MAWIVSKTPSDTFCILPWIHIYANPDGSVLPCCIADHHKHLGNVQQEKLEDLWNNEQFKKIRKNMMEGVKCEECTACYKTEDAGNRSFRQSANLQYSKYIDLVDETHSDGYLDKINLKYFDVRWSNICNFKCRSCSSTYSSSWAKEDNDLGSNKPILIYAGGKTNDILYEEFLPYFKDVEEFYFAGGEPLLTDKHYDILEHLILEGKTDVKLRYNTNLSNLKYKNKSIVDLWKHFTNIEIGVSIDSWGSRAEYIREGTDWQTIESNIYTIKSQLPHVKLQTHTVVSVFNVATLGDFINYMNTNELYAGPQFQPTFYNLINPDYYSFDVIPNSLKDEIRQNIASLSFSADIDRKVNEIVTSLDKSIYNKELHIKFNKQTEHYDIIRQQNFIETFPEIAGIHEVLL